MIAQDLLAALISLAHDFLDLRVDLPGGLLGIGFGLLIVAPDKDLLPARVADGADAVGHAVFCDHIAGNAGGALQIVRRTGGNIAELLRLCHAEEGDDGLKHLVARGIGAVVLRQADGHAAGLGAGDDGDEVHRILRVEAVHADRVSGLVDGGEHLFRVADHAALLFGACNDLDHRCLHILLADRGLAAPRGEERAFVQKVGQIRAGETGGRLGDGWEIDIVRQRLFPCMDLQDRKPSAPVGRTDVDLPVEAARAEQGGIENVLAVGRGDDDDALVGRETVHLDEQLVERLLALVVAAAEACAALTADRIDLIDEDDGRGHPLGLLKEVADTARTDADIEFDEVRAGNG